jgi:hypothetical protein
VTRVTPFGARFWDEATRRFVADGLRLRAWPTADTRGRATEGFANPSGVMLLAGLPGLRAAEDGAGDDAYWANVDASARSPSPAYRVQLSDRAGRFLPYAFDAHLPVRGFYPSPIASFASPPVPDAFPLFSAPARPLPPALAAIRAQLRTSAGRPASWALLEASWNGEHLCTGLADREGRVALYFAYPEPVPKPLHASPAPAHGEAAWDIVLAARHDPYASDDAVPMVETLERIFAQAPRTLLADAASAGALAAQTLHRAAELVVRSASSPYLCLQIP